MSFSKIFFSLVMSSPGGPDMVNGHKYYPNRHCSMAIAVNFGRETKNNANWCALQSWGIPRKTAYLILLPLYCLLKLIYFLVKSAYRQFKK